ncbi:MAG: hypothetical protein Q7R47_03460, partial [Candidatus Diapherotrites archaeon]|nr:hypothetical protein [Candidatus Diapherotrites archaeon]
MRKFFAILGALLILSQLALAADYSCTFDNTVAHINCNLVGASSSFCALAGPGAVANNPAVATTCSSSTIVCTLRNYTGSATTLRCSNTPSYRSGPTAMTSADGSTGLNTGDTPTCTYNDCATNQISCASAYAYQQCVPDPASPSCNHFQTTNCVANAPCDSSTAAKLAVCAGVPSTSITAQGGVYFKSTTTGTGNSTGGTNTAGNAITPNASSPYTYNGKTYYIVSGGNPAMNTGTKVCASVGKTCVGYTANTNAVCQYFHPTASVTTSVNGSKAGFYCNGPPQTGLACGASYNNCQVCPACNVNATCDEDIGGLFREMYVECAGAQGNAPANIPTTIDASMQAQLSQVA